MVEQDFYEEIPPAGDNTKPNRIPEEEIPAIINEVEELVVKKFGKSLMDAARCGCPTCKGTVYTAMDWLTYPQLVTDEAKRLMWNKAVEEARKKRWKERHERKTG